MPISQTKLTIAFDERDEDFIRQLARDIGCQYTKTNPRTYNLTNFGSDSQPEASAFAWVHKENKTSFWVSTRKNWLEQAKAMVNAGTNKSDINMFPRTTQHTEDSVCLNATDDYEKTVAVLSLIRDSR